MHPIRLDLRRVAAVVVAILCGSMSLTACASGKATSTRTPTVNVGPQSNGTQAPGALLKSFGKGGWAAIKTQQWSVAAAAAVQRDGKIVTAGQSGTGAHTLSPGALSPGGSSAVSVTRVDANGQPDKSFGSNGVATVPIGSNASANAIALLPNGNILAAGDGVSAQNKLVMAVVELLPNGQPNPHFGNNGVVQIPVGPKASANAVLAQPDGKIVVVGSTSSGTPSAPTYNAVAARLNPDGSPDTSYGDGGSKSFGAPADAWGAVLEPDGGIAVAGQSLGKPTEYFAGRLSANGQPDTSFGNNGVVRINLGSSSEADAIARAPNGDLILSGDAKGKNAVAVVRLRPNGRPVTSFGKGGTAEVTGQGANAVTVQHDGKVVVAGVGAGVIRFNANGTPDTSFGHRGEVLVARGSQTAANGVTIGPAGQLILSGASVSGSSQDTVVGELAGDSAGTTGSTSTTGKAAAYAGPALRVGSLQAAGVKSGRPWLGFIAALSKGRIRNLSVGLGPGLGTSRSGAKLARSIKITAGGHTVPFTVSSNGRSLAVRLHKPKGRIAVQIAGPGLSVAHSVAASHSRHKVRLSFRAGSARSVRSLTL
ncbi:MAG: hypothetical protein J2O48_05055 [Solirubrobacterales bacterium]|nr:hypothetical protein [Solirubrobacterales bacterium]